ncbi:MAG: hypothetical protein IKF09_05620 [Clostridiales bacterium]|nr:hypothetical protein [Clostridiales bacterium]
MAVLKSNLCPTCGGLLDIDLDKQMYICPFCGVSFDYEYFREDNVKEVASKAVRRSEFGSAKDAFDFMLSKDPHDFEALRGLFLCKNKWTDMDQMHHDSEVQVSADEPTLLNAIEKCRPEYKAYFEKVREALKELRHYRDLKTEAKSISKKKEKVLETLRGIQDEHYTTTHLFTEFCDEIRQMGAKAIEATISLTVIVPLMIIGYSIWQRSWGIIIAIVIIAALIIGGYHLIKFLIAKYLEKSMVPYEKEISELTEQYDAKNAEAVQSKKKYKDLVQEFMDMDPVPSKES